jgi:hypothetical protein
LGFCKSVQGPLLNGICTFTFANQTYGWLLMYWGVFCSTFAHNLSMNWYCFVKTWGEGAWHATPHISSLTFRGKLDPSLNCKVFLCCNDFIPPDTNPSSTPLWFVVFFTTNSIVPLARSYGKLPSAITLQMVYIHHFCSSINTSVEPFLCKFWRNQLRLRKLWSIYVLCVGGCLFEQL